VITLLRNDEKSQPDKLYNLLVQASTHVFIKQYNDC